MVSLDALLALVSSPQDSPEKRTEATADPKRRRRRHDWVRGDVRCLMCARLLGRLLGTDHHRQSTDRSTWHSRLIENVRVATRSVLARNTRLVDTPAVYSKQETHSKRERSIEELFDRDWYLARYPDADLSFRGQRWYGATEGGA